MKLKYAALEIRILEGTSEELIVKQTAIAGELRIIDEKLAEIPIIPVRCHELVDYLHRAFREAKRTITITSTLPSEDKFDFEVLGALKDCLARKVAVHIYISDRPTESGGTLARLDKLAKSPYLEVQFVTAAARPVFEIEFDGSNLCFANEPPLGGRRAPLVPREFSAYVVSNPMLVSQYKDNHLNFAAADIVSKIRVSSSREPQMRGSRTASS